MKLKKLVAMALSCTLVMGCLAGCAKNDATQTTTASNNEVTTAAQAETTTAAPVETAAPGTSIEACELTFWHAMNNKQEETLTALTDKFNAENPYGIKVTLVNQGYYSDLSTKLVANASADTLPDLAQAYNNWLSSYIDKVVHLDSFVANDFDNYEDILPGYRDENTQFGFVSGVPFNKSTYVLFYNKTMFDELGLTAPTTWDELISVAKVIKEKKGIPTIGFDDLAGAFQAALTQHGVDYIAEGTGAQFNTEAGLEVAEYFMGLYNDGYARLVGEDGYFSGVISNQLIATYVGSSTGASYITAEDWELGVAPLVGDKQNAANAAGTNIVMFSTDSNKQLAAWEYLKFLTSKESTLTWAMATGYLPVRTSAFESDEYQTFMATDPTSVAAYAQSQYFISQPAFAGSYDVMNAMNAAIEDAVLDELDAQDALDEFVKACNDILVK